MHWSVSVLSTVSSDTEPTLVFTFDSAKYLFNAGENTNRAFKQSKKNWRRTKGLFFTGVSPQRAGGLPGLIMSFAEATPPRMDVVGPPGLKHYLASMRMYVYRDSIPVIPSETPFFLNNTSKPEAVFKDENITVYSIPVYPSSDVPFPEASSDPLDVSDTLKRKRSPTSDSTSSEQPPTKRAHTDTKKTQADNALQEKIGKPNFTPCELVGEMAQSWRSLIVDIMFPKRPKADKGKPLKKKGKQKGGVKETLEVDETSVDEYRRSNIPPGFYSQLPTYSLPVTVGLPHSPRPSQCNAAYVIVGPRVRGKFDVAKALELGVPKGRDRSRLTQGESITFTVEVDDGVDDQGKPKKKTIERTVRPEDVLGPSDVPGAVIIMDVPTPAHIPSATRPFTNSPFYKKFRSSDEEDLKEYAVRAVYHILGDGVLEDARYREFMRGFWENTQHIVSSREHSPDPVTFTSAAYNQLRLSELDPEIFRVPSYNLTPKKELSAVTDLPKNVHLMVANLQTSMRPAGPPIPDEEAATFDLFHPVVTSPAGIEYSADTQQCFDEAKKQVARAQSEMDHKSIPKGADVRIITLGTGSAIPSKYRNVSGTLIMIPNYGNVLLDCGEGTWGQLIRHFGTDEKNEMNIYRVLKDLRCIYISHIHGDHHMGLAQVLSKRKELIPQPTEPLYLVAIRSVHLYLRELSDLLDIGVNSDPSENGVVTVLSDALHYRKRESYPPFGMWSVGGDEPWLDINLSKQNAEQLCKSLGLKSFTTADVRHRTRCYGCVLRHNDGWSIAFSGDTMPADSLVYASHGATLLIHEATMADDQEELAAKKAHSTLGQALDIGRRINAQNLLLTHFSARYPKTPKYKLEQEGDAESSTGFGSFKGVVAFAFDHADMSIGTMWKMNYYLPALESSYKQTVAEDGEDVDVEGGAAMEVDVNLG
ncbi:3 trna processing endoribonuclease [Moniliophthora roreri]|uniref:ribonuclease Z n=1 Tax=Moniliophthora roreri TaxID=221103 RepID=A0A0W0FB78_MONRR|nr:3 trna processing endoribonuclease [Moniliophthora roreri]